ncbi:hypothetical protein DE146DRAFT_617894 [Phaeosphaeria sp. MPI-PUGE-AT-0046c]|nr:hypothetical protein DE146DRAFT_617894 [Phaeosphaeria sp. MPI-PUGE-AT-0046c]
MQSNIDPFPPSLPHGELLQGPISLLLISHTGSIFDYEHQILVTHSLVGADCMRQLLEQLQSDHRPFCVEFPTQALVAASPAFAEIYDSEDFSSLVPLSLGNVLPGFAMCVLDWYGKALRSKAWYDFLPSEPLTDQSEKWYLVYCYSSMRSLGLLEFAGRLQNLVEHTLDSLSTDLNAYGHILRVISPQDPTLLRLAHLTAQRMQSGLLSLNDQECKVLAENFPNFATLVNRSLV